MENLLFFAAVAIISFVLNRNKNAKKAEQSEAEAKQTAQQSTVYEQNPYQQQEGELQVPVEQPRSLKEVAEMLFSMPQPQPVVDVKKQALEKELIDLKEQENFRHKQAELLKKQAVSLKREIPVTKNALRFGESDVVRGIIMSEILGPPRARKAYQRNYR